MGAVVQSGVAGLNQAVVYGQLVAEPEARDLPSGSVAVSFSLTVRQPGVKTTSVPMSWFDPPQRFWKWNVGDMVVARGSVVRRFYRAGGRLASATEVVVDQAQLERHQRRFHDVLNASAKQLHRITDDG